MKNYLIVIALLLFFQFNFAQDSNSPEYIKAVDYVTCICINDALPAGQTFNCQTETLSKETISDSKTRALFEEFQTLKTQRNIADYLNFLSEKIFSDEVKFKKIHDFAEKRKGVKLDKIKADIKEYIRSSTTSENRENTSSESSKITSDEIDSTVNNGENEPYQDGIKQANLNSATLTSSKFNIWTAITLGLIFVIAIFLLLFFFNIKNKINILNARIDRRIKKDELPNLASPHNFQNSNESLRIGKLESIIEKLEYSISKINSPTIYKEEKSSEVLFEVPKVNIPKSIVFYMATPNKEDGSFDISSQTENFKPTQSLYKFTVDNSNSSRAKFEFFSDEAGIRDSIDSPQTYIDPVCEPQNARNPNAKKIITTSPGTAEKRNDKWVKITNAKIKYE